MTSRRCWRWCGDSQNRTPDKILNQPWVDALHGDLGIVNSGDGALLLSNGGDIDELLVIIPHLKRTGPPASQ